MASAVAAAKPDPSTVSGQTNINPLREGIESNRIADPCTIVFFGASGDLFKRMLMPAVYSLKLKDILPMNFSLIGFARTPYKDEQFRDYCKQAVEYALQPGAIKETLWNDLAQRIGYITADFNNTKHFSDLKRRLEKDEKTFGASNRLFYLATPPSVFQIGRAHV